MNVVYLLLFFAVTGIHLYASLKNERLLRGSTKGLILILLLGFYLETASERSPVLIAALLFSWLGDMLLIPKGVKYFVFGGISFMISHGLFILTYSGLFSLKDVNPAAAAVIGAVYFAAVFFIFGKLKPFLAKSLFYPMYFYLLINGAMNCFALYRLIAVPGAASAVTAIGAIMFFISDSVLFFVRFNRDSVLKTHFLVMLTYSLGEFLIVLGLVL